MAVPGQVPGISHIAARTRLALQEAYACDYNIGSFNPCSFAHSIAIS